MHGQTEELNRQIARDASVGDARAGISSPPLSAPFVMQPGVEDPILGALYAVLCRLVANRPSRCAPLRRYIYERLGIFLPPARAELVASTIGGGNFHSSLGSPGHETAEMFVVINVLEAIDFLEPSDRPAAVAEVSEIEWFKPRLRLAHAWAGIETTDASGLKELNILYLADCREQDARAVPLRTRGARLFALRHGRHWLMCHDSHDDCPVQFEGHLWPTGHTLWLKASDLICFGDETIGAEALESLLEEGRTCGSSWVTWYMKSESRRLRLTRTPVTGAATLEIGLGALAAPAQAAISLNGKALTERTPVLPLDRLSIGAWSGLVAQLLRLVCHHNEQQRVHPWSVHLNQVSLAFPDGTQGLHELTASLQAGDFVAIMGSSGCGKSTLISLLSGEHVPTSGSITFEHRPNDTAPVFALVPQDDILFDNLTVAENLEFAARLRNSDSTVPVESSVQDVLKQIGLAGKCHLRVGSVVSKVLSGGQRKRLNIGLELTGKPDALLLDEPTSGLSSSDAMEVGRLLRKKADAGMLVVAILHQPSDELFELFDKLMVLDTGGRMACFGTAAAVRDWFARFTPRNVKATPETIMEVMGATRTVLDGRQGRRTYDPEFWRLLYESEGAKIRPDLIEVDYQPDERPSASNEPERPQGQARLGEAIRVVQSREWMRWCRDWPSTTIALSTGAVLALLIAWVCRTPKGGEYSFAENDHMTAYCFLAVILVQFLALSSSVQEVVKDRAIRKRERLLKVPGWVWLMGKLPYLTLQCALSTLLVLAAGIWVLEIPYAWSGLGLTLLLTAGCGVTLGLAVSSLPFITPRASLAAVPLLLVPQIVLCGADPFEYVKLRHLDWPFVANHAPHQPEEENGELEKAPWISAIVPARWGYQALHGVMRDHPFHTAKEDYRQIEAFIRVERQRNRPASPDQGATFWINLKAWSTALQKSSPTRRILDYNDASFAEHLRLAIRGGTAVERPLLGSFGQNLPDSPPQERNWENRTLTNYWNSFPPKQGRFTRYPAHDSWLILVALAAGFLGVAGVLLASEGKLEEAIRVLRSWKRRGSLHGTARANRDGTRNGSAGWQWKPVTFSGLFGFHGDHLCFHERRETEEGVQIIIDPAKPILPLVPSHPTQDMRNKPEDEAQGR